MTFTFNANLSTDRDIVRLNIGDTNSNEVLLADETIDALLVLFPDTTNCSVKCIDAILAREWRAIGDRTVIGISTNLSQRFQQLKDIQSQLLASQARTAKVYAGGTSKTANEVLTSDTDLVQPSISRGEPLAYSNE
jgi:hypothetical protein